jgi:hypothetical protein
MHQAARLHRPLSRRGLVSILMWISSLILAGCTPAAPSIPTGVPTSIPPSATPPPTTTSTPTPTSTSTLEPSWYRQLDASPGILKYQYALVENPRARVYLTPQDAAAGNGNFGYLPETPAYLAYSKVEEVAGKTYYFSPVSYGWMDGADLVLLTPSSFTGILLTRPVPYRFGWVLEDTISVNAAEVPVRDYSRYQLVHEVPAVTQKDGFVAVGPDEWLPEEKLAMLSTGLPADAGENTCRFIYANLEEQTLAVYDGCQLVFASLISSGANSWTFEGRFAVLYKEEYTTITNPAWSTSRYYMQGIPFFMTYADDFGFHAAYWHDKFGSAASHGCINLSPADAHWLFDWAQLGDRVIISPGK